MRVRLAGARSWAPWSALVAACSMQLAACGGGDPTPVPRTATSDQLAFEELLAGPSTLVIDADDAAAVDSGLERAERVHAFAGSKAQFGVFVRSRDSALAARLAERLVLEQGWPHVYVVR